MYICNTSGCKRNRTAAKPAHVLVVRRVTQTVRAVDPKSGDERWRCALIHVYIAKPENIKWADLQLTFNVHA